MRILNLLSGALLAFASGGAAARAVPLNAAQRLTMGFFNDDPQGRAVDYKAPHAPRGTPARPRHPRARRFRLDMGNGKAIVFRPRLFRGHRA
jgi:hypothetical protein